MNAPPAVRVSERGPLLALGAFVVLSLLAGHAHSASPPAPAEAELPEIVEPALVTLEEITITAPEPRYVSPTRRDRIGRIWAPVFINDQGPFRLVLDTGASHSGISAKVAEKLGLTPNQKEKVLMHGATGSAEIATVRVNSVVMGDMELKPRRMPIITDPLGGAEGILGNEGLADKRIYIDFRNDFIRINRSRRQRAEEGYIVLPIKFARNRLLTVDARIGQVPVTAIIDTGAEVTVANVAARDALIRPGRKFTIDRIEGSTNHIQEGERYDVPAIYMGGLILRSERMTFTDLAIFKHWRMTDQPAVLVGMDALGLFDTLIIDYARGEIHAKMR